MDYKKLGAFIGVILITLFLIKALDLSYPLTITTTNSSSELAVTGEGRVDVVPDTATISLGISVREASTVDAAQKSINEVNNNIIAGLQGLGIKKEDIKTSNYSIFPNIEYRENDDVTSGYNGSATVSVKVRNTAIVPEVISQATAAGANEIHGVSFDVEDPAKAREEARNKAIANAREQAEKLSEALDIRLGRVVNIVESSPGGPVHMFDRTFTSEFGKGGGGPEIEPGSQTVTSVVTLYFEKR